MQAPTFGYQLRLLRKHLLDMTQERLADLTEEKRSYIADLESDRTSPTAQFLEALTESTDVNIPWLYSADSEPFRLDVKARRNWLNKQNLAVTMGDISAGEPLPGEPEPPEPESVQEHVARFMVTARATRPKTPAKPSRQRLRDAARMLEEAETRASGVLQDYPAIRDLQVVQVALKRVAAADGVELDDLYLLANAFNVLATSK